MDDVIFEEFKGTGNMELILDRKLADRRLFPAIDIKRSGTRKEELLLSKEEMELMWNLRKTFNQSTTTEAIEVLKEILKKTKFNRELMLKTLDFCRAI